MAGALPAIGRVVVADDEPALLELLRLILERISVGVVTAPDGTAAWQAIQEHRPAVAVVDADMPGIDGLEITRLIRADPALEKTRVVLVTGHVFTQERAAAAGVDVSIAKPFSPTVLR